MARVSGPLLSFEASGSVASTLVFSKWKGRPYVRQLVIPSNPQTAAQVSVRAMMKFLSQSWALLGASPQATWVEYAAQTNISPFNGYTKGNMNFWSEFNSPSQVYPATRTANPGATPTLSATGGVGAASLAIGLPDDTDGWGVLIFRSTTTGFTPARNNCIAVVPWQNNTTFNYADGPLVPDEYFYVVQSFSTDGMNSSYATQDNAVVT